jgi:hypothetical protein
MAKFTGVLGGNDCLYRRDISEYSTGHDTQIFLIPEIKNITSLSQNFVYIYRCVWGKAYIL